MRGNPKLPSSFARARASAMGVFVNGTSPTNIQGTGDLSGFSFTFTNSKMEANQTAAGFFTFRGTPEQAGAALTKAGFGPANGLYEPGFNVFRSPGTGLLSANSGHFNVYQIIVDPLYNPPKASGNMHFGEHDPSNPVSTAAHCIEDQACN
jgi:hypothetical protein